MRYEHYLLPILAKVEEDVSQAQTIRVLIVDDHTIIRRGIKALLAQTENIQVVGEADNGLEAIRLSKELNPDVILMDLLMPNMDGIEATRQITAWQSNVQVLIITGVIFAEKIIPAIKAGARGCLLKDSEPWELVQSIYRIHRGEPSLPSSITRKMMEDRPDAPTEKTTQEPLTSRDVDVPRLLASVSPTVRSPSNGRGGQEWKANGWLEEEIMEHNMKIESEPNAQ